MYVMTASNIIGFYRATEIACRPSVCLSVCDVGGSESHRLEILETNCMDT